MGGNNPNTKLSPLLFWPIQTKVKATLSCNVMKFQDDDGPGDIKLTAWEENLGMVQSRTYDLCEMAQGMFHGKGKGRDSGRNKFRKTERKERKCSGGV